jgi:hypothetical protein
MRENDVDCIRSGDMDLQPQFFQPDYSFALVNVQLESKELEELGVDFDREIRIQPQKIYEMFKEQLEKEPKFPPEQQPVEPDCDLYEDEEETKNDQQVSRW